MMPVKEHLQGPRSYYSRCLYHEDCDRCFSEMCRKLIERGSGLLQVGLGDSPVEVMFSEAYRSVWGSGGFPASQVHIGPYRVDFQAAHQVVVEIDGHEFHKSKEDRAKDASRDRYLAEQGIVCIRFTGSEVYKDAIGCARQAFNIARSKGRLMWEADKPKYEQASRGIRNLVLKCYESGECRARNNPGWSLRWRRQFSHYDTQGTWRDTEHCGNDEAAKLCQVCSQIV